MTATDFFWLKPISTLKSNCFGFRSKIMHPFFAEIKHLITWFCLCGQNAFMDLVDVFAMPSEPPSDRPWNASHPGDTDPWDSLGEPCVDQFNLYWKAITLMDEDHINDYQNHSKVELNFKDVEVRLSFNSSLYYERRQQHHREGRSTLDHTDSLQ